MAQLIGEVKWFNNLKGYGFLGHEGGPDVFIHYSAIDVAGYKTLNAGDQVFFTIVKGDSGKLQADKVTRLNDAQQGSPSIAPAVWNETPS